MSAPYPLFKYIIVGHFCKYRDRYHKISTIPHPLIKCHSLSPTTNNVTLFYLVAVIFSFVIIISMRGQLPFHHLNLWYKERMAPEGINVYNPAFDVTDHELITAIITEDGVITDFTHGFTRKQ